MSQSEFKIPSVRRATSDDFPAIAKFLQPFLDQNTLKSRPLEDPRIAVENGFVAECSDQIVGYATLEVYSTKLAKNPKRCSFTRPW